MKTDIETSLNRAVDRLPHPTFADIADPPVKKMEEMDSITRQEPLRRKPLLPGFYRYAVPVFLCLLLVLPGARYINRNLITDSVIDLDVNPSIEITANQRDHVLKVTGINEDAKEILGPKDYHGWTVEAAVEDIVILLNQKNYISKDKNTILLSVSSRSTDRAERMKQELYVSISRAFSGTDVKPVVIRQNRTGSRDIRQKAGQYLISPGKMQLIEEMTRQAPDLAEDELAKAPVEELYRMIRTGRTEIPDWLEIDEDDWDDWEPEDDDFGEPDEEESEGRDGYGKDGRGDGEDDRDDEDGRDDDKDDRDDVDDRTDDKNGPAADDEDDVADSNESDRDGDRRRPGDGSEGRDHDEDSEADDRDDTEAGQDIDAREDSDVGNDSGAEDDRDDTDGDDNDRDDTDGNDNDRDDSDDTGDTDDADSDED